MSIDHCTYFHLFCLKDLSSNPTISLSFKDDISIKLNETNLSYHSNTDIWNTKTKKIPILDFKMKKGYILFLPANLLSSIKFLEPLSTEHPPIWFLLLTPCLVLIAIPIAYYLFVKNKDLSNAIASMNKPLYNFLINKWYFDELYDVLFIKSSKKLGLFLWKFCDGTIIDGFGPDGISSFIKKCSIKATKFQSGYIYQYAFVMLLGFSALLTFLIVK